MYGMLSLRSLFMLVFNRTEHTIENQYPRAKLRCAMHTGKYEQVKWNGNVYRSFVLSLDSCGCGCVCLFDIFITCTGGTVKTCNRIYILAIRVGLVKHVKQRIVFLLFVVFYISTIHPRTHTQSVSCACVRACVCLCGSIFMLCLCV